MFDMTTTIEVLLGVISLVITVVLIPYIRKKHGSEQLAIIAKWLEIACYAAEEMARTGLIGKDEKHGYVEKFLAARGIIFDEVTTQALIKSTVYDLFNRFKEESETTDSGEDE